MLVLAVLLGLIVRNEIRLDLHHKQAVARVVSVEEGIRGPGSIRVEFIAEGRPVDATVARSWFGARPEPGEHVRIEYLKPDPHVARRAGAHDAVTLAEGLAVLALLVIAAVYLGPRRRRSRRLRWGSPFRRPS